MLKGKMCFAWSDTLYPISPSGPQIFRPLWKATSYPLVFAFAFLISESPWGKQVMPLVFLIAPFLHALQGTQQEVQAEVPKVGQTGFQIYQMETGESHRHI